MFTSRALATLVSASGTTYTQDLTALCGVVGTVTKGMILNQVLSAGCAGVASLVALLIPYVPASIDNVIATSPLLATFQRQINKILIAEE